MRNGGFSRFLNRSIIAAIFKKLEHDVTRLPNACAVQNQMVVCSYSSSAIQSAAAGQSEPQLSVDLINIMDQKLCAIQLRHAHLQGIVNQRAALPEEYSKANKELKKLQNAIDLVTDLRSKHKEIEGLKSVIAESQDDKGKQEMSAEELNQASQEEKQLQFLLLKSLLPNDDADERGCILEVRAGTGGDDASLFAMDIFRMYEKYSLKKGWKFETLDLAESDLKGYKEARAAISGADVFGKLKFESGIHRVQRVPVTGRVHTGAVSVAVPPKADQVDVQLRSDDLKVETYRSGGLGGQHANTTNSAVRITHIPSGLTVSIQNERSQHQVLHQFQKADEIAHQKFKLHSISSLTYIVNPNRVYTTACNSVETPDEQTCLAGYGDKTEDTTALLREWGCSESDISKIFERRPSLRKSDTRILQSKLEILSKLGITSADLVKMVNCRPRFLNSRINILLNERLEYLETICGSREVLLKAIVRNPSLLTYDFHNKIKPVIAMYESLGICKSDFITVLLSRPTLIPRTNLDDEKIEYIRKTGVSKESKLYKHVVALFAISRTETIREKVVNLEKFGFLEDEIFDLIGRSPLILTLSVDKVQRQMTFILGTLKLSASVVLRNPFLLYFNLETVLKPRFQMACMIEDKGLFPPIKGPGLLTALRMKDKRFISAFFTCHPKDVAKELVTFYRDAKSVRRLAESSKKNTNKGFPF